jgi:hypothetical protein
VKKLTEDSVNFPSRIVCLKNIPPFIGPVKYCGGRTVAAFVFREAGSVNDDNAQKKWLNFK